jgi:hypothetical protein
VRVRVRVRERGRGGGREACTGGSTRSTAMLVIHETMNEGDNSDGMDVISVGGGCVSGLSM